MSCKMFISFFFFLTSILFKNYKFCECLIWTTYTRLGNYFKWFSPELCSDFEQAWRNRFVFISSEVFRRPIFFWGLQGEWILMYLSGSDWLVLGEKFGGDPLWLLIAFIFFYLLLKWSSCCPTHIVSITL